MADKVHSGDSEKASEGKRIQFRDERQWSEKEKWSASSAGQRQFVCGVAKDVQLNRKAKRSHESYALAGR